MTDLYIMRHGDAVSRAATDAERPLSDRGRLEAASMVDLLLPNPPETLWVSPYVRAQQTADIIIDGLAKARHTPQLKTVESITPNDNPFKVVELLSDHSSGSLMLVSHNPLVSILLSLLTEGHNQAAIGMATASIACLQGEVPGLGTMDLQWYQSPSNQV